MSIDRIDLKIREDFFESTRDRNTCLDIRALLKGKKGCKVTLGNLSALFHLEGKERVFSILSYITGDLVHLLDVSFEDKDGNTLDKGEAATLPKEEVYIVFIATGV